MGFNQLLLSRIWQCHQHILVYQVQFRWNLEFALNICNLNLVNINLSRRRLKHHLNWFKLLSYWLLSKRSYQCTWCKWTYRPSVYKCSTLYSFYLNHNNKIDNILLIGLAHQFLICIKLITNRNMMSSFTVKTMAPTSAITRSMLFTSAVKTWMLVAKDFFSVTRIQNFITLHRSVILAFPIYTIYTIYIV